MKSATTVTPFRPFRTALRGTVAAFALSLPVAVYAQDAGEAQPATDDVVDEVTAGNEIIVTATKRERTLQDVPVAVSVTTAATLEQAQIRDIKDLSSVVPSLRVNQLQSSANTNFYIRGFGNGANNAGIEPSVGLFVDGVYRSRSASMITDLPDVQRVEVLRGPQSTLFGKNASAGVISIVTRKPQFEFGGNVEASYGNYNAIVLKGLVTGPLSENIAMSIAGGYNARDGYIRDLGTGKRTNERNRWFTRGQLLFEGDSPLTIRLIGDYAKIDEDCCGVVNLRTSAATQAILAIGGKVNSAAEPFKNIVYNNFPSTNKITNWGMSGQADYDLGVAKLTSITAYRKTDAVTNQDSDFTSADLLGRNYQDLRIKTFTQEFRMTADLLDKLSLLLGGYYFRERIAQHNEVQFGTQFRPFVDLGIRSATGGAQNVALLEGTFGTLTGNPARYVGQFFGAGQGLDENYRLKNDSWSLFGQLDFEVTDGITLTGGLNYTHDKKTFSTNVVSDDVFGGIDLPAMVTAATNAGVSQTVCRFMGPLCTTGLASAAQIGQFAAANPAGYQQIVAGVNAQTQPLLALRAQQLLPPFMNVPNAVESGKVSDNNLSYTVRLAWDATDTINVYASYATGYKGASVNLSRDSRPTPADLTAIRAQGIGVTNLTSGSRYADPEKAKVMEFGLKGNWGVTSANIAVFKQTITGFQSNIFTGTGFFLANAGKQSAFGIEFEGMAKPIDPLTLTLAMTYLDPKYDKFLLSAFGDLSGSMPAGVPPISATFGAAYDHEFGNGDHVILRGDYHYESLFKVIEGLPGFVVKNPITGAVINTAPALQVARDFRQDINDVNASLTYVMHNGLELTVWGRNLLNDRTILQIFDSVAQAQSVSGYLNQPRTYGVAARFRW